MLASEMLRGIQTVLKRMLVMRFPTADAYTLSLHDALPIFRGSQQAHRFQGEQLRITRPCSNKVNLGAHATRSEEHTSELQSHHDLVCRLLLEKKKHHSPLLHINKLNHQHQQPQAMYYLHPP